MPQFDLAGNPMPDDVRSMPKPDPIGSLDEMGQPVPGARPAGMGQSSVWPPPPATPYAQVSPENLNTSGAKAGVPPEISALKWNWGAFLLPGLWCLNHKKIGLGIGIIVVGILARLIPGVGLIGLGFSIYLGLKGHEIGWENRRFESGLAQFFEVQTAWMRWGFGILIGMFGIGIVAAILFPILAQMRVH